MDIISIHDSKQRLVFVCEDLKALKATAQVIEAEEDWSSERDMLAVMIRALTPIIDDIQESIEAIDTALKKEQNVQQDRSGVSETA